MNRHILATLVVVVCGVLALVGCRTNPISSDGAVAPTTIVAPPVTQDGTVRFAVEFPGLVHGSVRTGIRATGKAGEARVRFILRGLNVTNTSQPQADPVEIVSPVSADGTAQATFNNVSTLPTIGQVRLENAVWNGVTDFQGATNVTPGPNTLTVNPTGSGLSSEMTAHVLESLVTSPTAWSNVGNGAQLIDRVRQIVRQIDTQDPQARTEAVNRTVQTLLTTVSSSNFTYFSFDSTRQSLKGLRSGAEVWSRRSLDFWNTGELGGNELDLSQMMVHGILRQGVDGFGYVTFRHATLSPFGIARVDTATGSRVAYVRNTGRCDQAVLLPDGSIVVGGTNDDRRCPILFKWTGQGLANTTSNAGNMAGLAWEHLFTECPANASWTSPAVESIQYDGGDTLVVMVRKPALNLAVPYYVSLTTGNTTAQVSRADFIVVQAGAADGIVSLTWNPIETASSYNVYWGTAAGLTTANATKISGITSPSYVHRDRTNNTRYFYAVTAVINGTESALSGEISAIPQAGVAANRPPAAPTFTAPTSGATAVALNPTLTGSAFSDPDSGDVLRKAEFEIYDAAVATDSRLVWLANFVPTTTTTGAPTIEVTAANGAFTGARAGAVRLAGQVTYYARVRYFDQRWATGDWSAMTPFTTAVEPNEAPFAPTIVVPNTVQNRLANDAAVLQGSAFRDPNAGDTLGAAEWQVAVDNAFSSVIWSASVPATTTAKIDNVTGTFAGSQAGRTRIAAGLTCFVRVRYTDGAAAASSWSATKTFTTYEPNVAPAQPSLLAPTNGATAVSLNATLAGSAFSDPNSADTMGTVEFEVYKAADLAAGNLVWSAQRGGLDAAAPTVNIDTTAGAFVNALAGKTRLAALTQYWARVRYNDNNGTPAPGQPRSASPPAPSRTSRPTRRS